MQRSLHRWRFVPLLYLISCFVPTTSNAQIDFSFSTNTSSAYTAITGGTVIFNVDADNNLSGALPIGFSFQYAGDTYTEFKVSSNGWISLGTVANNNMATNNLSTTGQGPILAPLWDNLLVVANSTTYKTTGAVGSRILTVQFSNVRWTRSATSGSISFQVKLYEGTNVIEFQYETLSGSIVSASASIGISGGTSSSDFYSVRVSNGNHDARYNNETNNISTRPGNGRVYRWTPNNMFYVSSTTGQVSGDASKCFTQHAVLSVQIKTQEASTPMTLTQLRFNIAGTNVANLSGIQVYYTGTSSSFAATNKFNSGTITPAAGDLIVNGSRQLASGVNFFWIAFDLSANAVATETLDAICSEFTLNGVDYIPDVTDPPGARSIIRCLAPGGVIGSSFWVKANDGAGTANNSKLATWQDRSGNSRNATNAVAANQPTYLDNAGKNLNYNPVVDFDEANQDKTQADFMDVNTNGILSSGNNPYEVYAVIIPGVNNLTTPGKFLFSGEAGSNNFNAFDVRSNYAINDSWNLNDLIVNNTWKADSILMLSFDYDGARREAWSAGTTLGTRTSSSVRTSPNTNGALAYQRSGNLEYYDGGIAEIVSYANTTHNTITRHKVESYLAIKYGVTLSHDYYSSTGTTIWSRATNYGYNNSIIGVARDNASALSQKQAKSTTGRPDILRINIGSVFSVNQANNTTNFSASDTSFFMTGHNNGVPFNLGSQDIPPGICCRLERAWLVQKTNFSNSTVTLVFDFTAVTPGYIPLSAADLRLLVDNDGNFTNATVLNTPTITISAAASVATITVPVSAFNSTPYFTLASVSANTLLPLDILSFTGACRNEQVQLKWTTAGEVLNDFIVERSADRVNFTPVGVVKKNSTANYGWTDLSPVPGTVLYRLKTVDAQGAMRYSAATPVAGCGSKSIQLSTNPLTRSSTLIMQLGQNSIAEIGLFDVMGRRVDVPELTGRRSLSKGLHTLPVHIPGTVAGWYTLQVVVNNDRQVFRVFKQ